MIVRRSPAIVLSLVLSAAALSVAPALAMDGGAATDGSVERDWDSCGPGTATKAKLRVGTLEDNSLRLLVVGTVWSDDDDSWDWRLKHNGEVSDDGRARGPETGFTFRVSRTMFNGFGVDDVVFRAENVRTGEVCRAVVDY